MQKVEVSPTEPGMKPQNMVAKSGSGLPKAAFGQRSGAGKSVRLVCNPDSIAGNFGRIGEEKECPGQ